MLVQMLDGFVHDDIATVKEELEEHVKVRWQKQAQQKVATMLLTWLVRTDHRGPNLEHGSCLITACCQN